jgi:succinyl-CoA synthetase beta subunit
MKIHEYQAKELFREFGINAPEGVAVKTADEAVKAAEGFGMPVMVKAQVHVGGRGKAGGVKFVGDAGDVKSTAEEILALTIKDLPVRTLLITPASDIDTEVYLSILLDRGARKVVFIGCADGGVEIEETAKTNPEKILRLELTAKELATLEKSDVLDFAAQLFPDPKQADATADIMVKLAKLFVEKDASLIEINPLISNGNGDIVALDGKMMLDDNALFRHEELVGLRDMESEDQDELDATESGLSFIRLAGSIGCMVNGAGLAMATMDTIKHFGGSPANFLDVGGSSDPEKVVIALKMILKDPEIKVILINIFGGITRCDDIAKGIIASIEQFDVGVPLIVRLVGTNEEEGRALLEGTELISATTLEQGATKAAEIGGQS